MTDLTAAPRPVPTTEDRMRDARTDRSFATYLGATERDQLDARAACAEQERDEALDARNVVRQQLDAMTAERDRLADELDSTQQVATFRQGVIDLHAAELGAAGEVIAVVRDAQEQIERALARYDTTPNQWRHHPCGLTTTLPDSDRPTGGWCNRCQNDLGTDSWVAVTPGLGSAPPRAQEQPPMVPLAGWGGGHSRVPARRAQEDGAWMNRRATVSDALGRALTARGYDVPLPVRDRCAEAVLAAQDADRAEREG